MFCFFQVNVITPFPISITAVNKNFNDIDLDLFQRTLNIDLLNKKMNNTGASVFLHNCGSLLRTTCMMHQMIRNIDKTIASKDVVPRDK